MKSLILLLALALAQVPSQWLRWIGEYQNGPERLIVLEREGKLTVYTKSAGYTVLTEAGPAALSAAMLAGSMEEAIALANAKAQAWTAVATIESAQRLLDEGMPRRAAALLAATDARADRAERRGLRRL